MTSVANMDDYLGPRPTYPPDRPAEGEIQQLFQLVAAGDLQAALDVFNDLANDDIWCLFLLTCGAAEAFAIVAGLTCDDAGELLHGGALVDGQVVDDADLTDPYQAAEAWCGRFVIATVNGDPDGQEALFRVAFNLDGPDQITELVGRILILVQWVTAYEPALLTRLTDVQRRGTASRWN